MRNELTITQLDTEHVELLPPRETLFYGGNHNWAAITATNSSMALNAATFGSVAQSAANQAIWVSQG